VDDDDDFEFMYCVHPDDDCEEPYTAFEVGLGDINFSPIIALIGIAIANVLQYLYLLMIILTTSVKVNDVNNLEQSNKKCALQSFVVVVSLIIVTFAGNRIHLITQYGAMDSFIVTMTFAFFIDQSKSFIFHLGVWYFFLRRCGYLASNEQDYINPDWANVRKDTFVNNCR
jgi:hypothetical protein